MCSICFDSAVPPVHVNNFKVSGLLRLSVEAQSGAGMPDDDVDWPCRAIFIVWLALPLVEGTGALVGVMVAMQGQVHL